MDAREDLGGALVTPGLVNTHHHLYQTLTRARAQEADLFTWLKTLYPVWARIDAEAEHAAAKAGLAELALSGCTTVFDHHYVFPRGGGDLVEAEMTAARELGMRLIPSRGSMDLGESDGGLPPDSLVEDPDEVLAETERLAALATTTARAIAVAPCSPFSVSGAADARVRRARARGWGCSCTRTWPRPSRRRRTARSCTAAGRSSTSSSSAGSTATSGARTASTSRRRRHRALRGNGHRRRALPDLEPASRRRRGPGSRRCWTPACASGSASTARPRTSAAISSSRSSRRCSSRADAAAPGR